MLLRRRAPLAELLVLLGLPLAKLCLHLATYPGYGVFRDELYYLASTDHLAWGFVDHPPLSIVLLALMTGLLGDSLFVVRLLPALAGAATVLLVGLTARRLGGGAFAQALAMLSAVAAPLWLALHHVYSMNAFDILVWAWAAYLLIPLLEKGREAPLSGWLLLGVVLGLGLLNKWSVLWLGFGLAVGLVASRQRRLLATPGPWLAGAVALVLFLPNLLWQQAHDWPTLEFMANARAFKMAGSSVWELLADVVLAMHPLAAPVWVAGLLFFFLPSRHALRPLGWAWLTVFLLLALSGSSRVAYLAPSYSWLLAAGGVRWETMSRLIPRPAWQPVARAAALAVMALSGAALAPLGIPLLPVPEYVAHAERLGVEPATEETKELAELPQFFADMHGWPEIAAAFERAVAALPEDERRRAAIFAQNYGVAGALERFGRGLPPVVSGHNSYWLWGFPPIEDPVLIVHGGSREELLALFEEVELTGRIDCTYCMPYEDGQPIWRASGSRRPLAELWPQVKSYD